MSDIFFSYSSNDREQVQAVHDILSEIGFELRPGSATAMVRGIKVEDGRLLSLYDPRMKAKEKGH